MKRIAQFIDAALNLYSPIVHARSAAAYTDTTNTPDADLLADCEADTEVWDPDELWAAVRRHPVGKLRDNQTADDYVRDNRHLFAVPNHPAEASADPPGLGGPTPTELSLAITIGNVLRACETPWPTTTAGIVTRELLHHYHITPKTPE